MELFCRIEVNVTKHFVGGKLFQPKKWRQQDGVEAWLTNYAVHGQQQLVFLRDKYALTV